MKKLKAIKHGLFAFILFTTEMLHAQVGIGTATPATSAQLDVSSTTKGLLPPRMTQAQRNAILNPAAGLMVWCKDCGVLGEIQVYNGGTWMNMTGGYPALPIPSSVVIGTQEWTTRNLDVATYRNGDTIPQVIDTATWNNLKTGAWCYYNNDPAMGELYGKLYNWYAVTDGRGLAPFGWRIPGNGANMDVPDDWDSLKIYLGGASQAGAKMRATTLWTGANTDINNGSGFTGLPGGQRSFDGSFSGVGATAAWWSGSIATFHLPMRVYYILNFGSLSATGFGRGGLGLNNPVIVYEGGVLSIHDTTYPVKNYGFSVRCIKD